MNRGPTPHFVPGKTWTLTDAEAMVLRRIADGELLVPGLYDVATRKPILDGPAIFAGPIVVGRPMLAALVALRYVEFDGLAHDCAFVLTDHGDDRVAALAPEPRESRRKGARRA